MSSDRYVPVVLLPIVVLTSILLVAPRGATAQDPTWDTWGKPLADRLLAFVPTPPPGLVDSVPWEETGPAHPDEGNSLCGQGVVSGCAQYYGVRVAKTWLVYDSALVARVVEIKRRQDAILARVSRQTPQEELNRLLGETSTLEKESDNLKRALRSMEYAIVANGTPATWFASTARPSGTVKGYPLYNGGGRYVVYVGPSGFTNPIAAPGQASRTEIKSLVVSVWVGSNTDPTAGQALVRQLLERVDYAGLAKLLAP